MFIYAGLNLLVWCNTRSMLSIRASAALLLGVVLQFALYNYISAQVRLHDYSKAPGWLWHRISMTYMQRA